ncbi:hypothetical protein AXG93_3017s1450 [Marchantia polymorpha subsp. ruderalis]|uniref:Uncharacterized protein n=1 Tax=Marchantia polymorpha subsp. ruderalis TaxID=1480154 RepID=A0A176WHK8_MARPO|nr:hypothetical protein AXG93_3017s1450 [Marchantia polymorpha subsp. ruderalis]
MSGTEERCSSEKSPEKSQWSSQFVTQQDITRKKDDRKSQWASLLLTASTAAAGALRDTSTLNLRALLQVGHATSIPCSSATAVRPPVEAAPCRASYEKPPAGNPPTTVDVHRPPSGAGDVKRWWLWRKKELGLEGARTEELTCRRTSSGPGLGQLIARLSQSAS